MEKIVVRKVAYNDGKIHSAVFGITGESRLDVSCFTAHVLVATGNTRVALMVGWACNNHVPNVRHSFRAYMAIFSY